MYACVCIRPLPPPRSRPPQPLLTLWKSIEERMRFWLSFSVSPVTNAPVEDLR